MIFRDSRASSSQFSGWMDPVREVIEQVSWFWRPVEKPEKFWSREQLAAACAREVSKGRLAIFLREEKRKIMAVSLVFYYIWSK